MAQHDYILENQRGRDFRADLNNALQAIATNNLGGSLPTSTFPGMIAIDRNQQSVFIRSLDNTLWYNIGTVQRNLGQVRIERLGNGLGLTNGVLFANFPSFPTGRLDAIEADGWVTTPRIANNAVTETKLSSDVRTKLNSATGVIAATEAGLFLVSTGDTAGDYEWQTITDAVSWIEVRSILSNVYDGQTVAERTLDYLEEFENVRFVIPPKPSAIDPAIDPGPVQVYLGQGNDVRWEEYFPLPKPATDGLVLTSVGTDQVRWEEAVAQGPQTINEMIADSTADARIYDNETYASAIASRQDLGGDYTMVLGNLDDLRLNVSINRLEDAEHIQFSIINNSGRTEVHRETWTRVQEKRVIPFNISNTELSGAGGRFQREDGRSLYRFVITFLDSSNNPIAEINHHAELWLEDGIIPLSTGGVTLESGEFEYRQIDTGLVNNSTFSILDNENTLYFQLTLMGSSAIATKSIKVPDAGTVQAYAIEEQNQNVAGFTLSRTANNFTITNLSRITSVDVYSVKCVGAKGERGGTGLPGIQGPIGMTGPQGIQGIPGEKGEQGERGEPGIIQNSDPQGLKIAEITFSITETESLIQQDWSLTPDSLGNQVDGARLSLRTSRPATSRRDVQARMGYIFRISRTTGSGPTVDSEAFYLYGEEEKLILGINAQIASTLEHGSVDLQLSYGRSGNYVDVRISNPSISAGWQSTTYTQQYTVEVYELEAKGDVGPPGMDGAPGQNGDPGMDGAPGRDGERGPIGMTGPQGERGIQGQRGMVGPKGDEGQRGPQGLMGNPGPRGIQGIPGEKGEMGDPGPQGSPGSPGSPGIPGIASQGNPEGDKIATTTFTVDQNTAVDREDWDLVITSTGNEAVGTRLSLRINRPTTGSVNHTSRIGYMFRLIRTISISPTQTSTVVDSEGLYIYGETEKITLGFIGQSPLAAYDGSIDITFTYGRDGNRVDVAINTTASIDSAWSSTTFEQEYTLDVHELVIQGDRGPTGERGPIGERGFPGIQGPMGLTGPMGLQGIQGPPFNPTQETIYPPVKDIIRAGNNVNIDLDETDSTVTINATPATGTAFNPSQQNIYAATKAILVPGTNTTLTENDSASTIAVNSTATGGGPAFNPSQQNIYAATKAILVPGTNTTLTEDDSTFTIAVNSTATGGSGTTFNPSKANIFDAVREIIVHTGSPAATADAANNEIDITNVDQTARNNANTGITNAAVAQTTANTANRNANTALTTARNAESTADTANTNASAAQSTADTANTNASAAQSTANTANTNANNALSTATTASTTATNALNVANTKLDQSEVDARVNALAIPQGDVEEIDVLTSTQYTAATKDENTLYLVEGVRDDFAPTQQNLYEPVKAIIEAGDNITISFDDTDRVLTISGQAGGGPTFTPSKANIFDAVREIIVHSGSPGAAADTSNNEIDITGVDQTARNSASAAQSTANTANATANTALTTARNAESTATTASTTATTASTTATNALNVANTKLNQSQVDARVNALAIPQGDVDTIDVLTVTDYDNIATKDNETLYLVEGSSDFVPTKANIYPVIKQIFQEGTDIELGDNDRDSELTVNVSPVPVRINQFTWTNSTTSVTNTSRYSIYTYLKFVGWFGGSTNEREYITTSILTSTIPSSGQAGRLQTGEGIVFVALNNNVLTLTPRTESNHGIIEVWGHKYP